LHFLLLIKDFIKKNKFIKNTLTLVSGTAIAQIIPIILTPVLTRLYSPEEFGLFSLYTSLVLILSVVATGRYELAIMIPENRIEALNLAALSILIAFIYSFIISLIITIFPREIASLLGQPDIKTWLFFLPISIFLIGVYQSVNYWTNRNKFYKKIAQTRVLQSLVNGSVNITFSKLGATGLIGGYIIGQLFATTFLIYKNASEFKKICTKVNFKEMLRQSKNYIDFPVKSSIGALLNVLASYLPLLLIGIFYGPTVMGLFSLTLKTLSTPISIIGNSVSQVFYERAVNASRVGGMEELFKKTTFYLFLIIVFPMLVLFIFGERIFSIAFGKEWKEAGIITQYLIPFYFVRFIFSAQSSLLMVKRKLKFEIKINFLFLLGQLLSIFIGYYCFSSYKISFIILSLAGFITFLYLGWYLSVISKEGGQGSEEDIA
jgi:lipopolysaccharide exporter